MNPEEYEVMRRVEDAHWWYRGLRSMIRAQVNRYLPKGASRVLDVGCGTGANLALVSERASAIGVDLSRHALERAVARGVAPALQANAEALPVASESCDAVLMMDLLYHRDVHDKVAPLREANRVLKPRGLLLVNLPAYQWMYSSHDRAIHTDKRFTRREVVSLMREAELEVAWISYWNTMLFPALALFRMLRQGDETKGSDLDDSGGGLTAFVASMALACERVWLRIAPLPFGLSIFAVARKP